MANSGQDDAGLLELELEVGFAMEASIEGLDFVTKLPQMPDQD